MDGANNNSWTAEEILGIISWIIILFIPTIGITEAINGRQYTETTLYWPWFVLSNLKPSDIFNTDQYNYFGFPWSFILFIPFFYGLKFGYNLFKGHGDRIQNAGQIALVGLIQMAILWVTYRSQTPGVREEITVYFIPELLLFLVYGYFTGIWYIDQSKQALEDASDIPTHRAGTSQQDNIME